MTALFIGWIQIYQENFFDFRKGRELFVNQDLYKIKTVGKGIPKPSRMKGIGIYLLGFPRN